KAQCAAESFRESLKHLFQHLLTLQYLFQEPGYTDQKHSSTYNSIKIEQSNFQLGDQLEHVGGEMADRIQVIEYEGDAPAQSEDGCEDKRADNQMSHQLEKLEN